MLYSFITLSWLALFIAVSAGPAWAQSPASEQHAREVYKAAKLHFETDQKNVAAGWQLGRAAFDLADLVQENQERQEIAQTGIDGCRRAIQIDPGSAAAHFYLGLDLGQLARSKKLSALKLLREMERELLTAAQLDSAFDYGGPDRSLGILYLHAPAWPASIGNRKKARAHLEAAVQISPDYPENHLALAEAYSSWSELKNLEHAVQRLEKLLPSAKTRFAGEVWAASWKDWDSRLRKLQKARDRLLTNPRTSPSDRGAVKAK